MLLLWACRAERESTGEVVLDAEGLPDCVASYDAGAVCSALSGWDSEEVDGFVEEGWNAWPVRWIGTEVQPAFCAESAEEAEAFALEQEADEGSHSLVSSDSRWFDLRRFDADGVLLRQDRVMHCDFMAAQAETPPGTSSVADFATYAGEPDPALDFYPVAREWTRWRQTALQIQVVLAFGEVGTEREHLRVCSVRCGDCEDGYGSILNVTGVLETQDWSFDAGSKSVSWEVVAELETDCEVHR